MRGVRGVRLDMDQVPLHRFDVAEQWCRLPRRIATLTNRKSGAGAYAILSS